MANPRRVTLAEVALHAGVSKATASKVLNDRDDVAPATRARVRQAMSELGYAPSTAARSLGSRSVAIVFDTVHSYYSLHVLSGAMDAAAAAGIVLDTATETSPAPGQPRPFDEDWFEMLAARGTVALVVVTSALTDREADACRAAGLVPVLVDPAGRIPDGMTSIGATNWAGGMQATKYLISIGHRRIGYISGSSKSIPSNERLAGYRSALDEHGIEFDPDLIVGGGFDYEDGRKGAVELLSLPEIPTAIFAACDVSAVGVLEGARQLGVRVPKELSVVGFDDTSLAQWCTPQLTTVRQPLSEMGAAAVRTALELVDTAAAPGAPVQLTTRLIERASTAKPR